MNWQFPRLSGRLAALCWRWLPGSITSLLAGLLFLLGTWQSFDLQAYNTLFRWRGSLPWDDRIAVVAIDDASLSALGRFPLSRRIYARLLDQLTEAQAAIVVFNLVFSEPTPDDPYLIDAITQNGRVVLAQAWDYSGLPLLPTEDLNKIALATGHILIRPDQDGISRRIDPIIQNVPSLSVAATTAFSLLNSSIPAPNLDRPLWLNWLSPVAQMPTYSLIQVLNGQVPAKQLYNKLVIVGITAAGVDKIYTPFDRDPPASGVHVEATSVSNLLQNRPLKIPGNGWLVLLWLLTGPVWGGILAGWHWQRKLLWLVSALGSWVLISYLAFHADYWLPTALPMVGLVSTTIGAGIGNRLRRNLRLQRDIQRLWQIHYDDRLSDLLALTNFPTTALIPTNQPDLQLAQLADLFARAQSANTAIVRNVSLGLLATTTEGWVWFCNPMATDWLGVHVGDYLLDLLTTRWGTVANWQADWQALSQGEQRYREIQNEEQWLAFKLEPLSYQPALAQPSAPLTTAISVLIVVEDITTRKQAQEELQNTIARERELSTMKSSFATMMSHELRTPLTAINTAAELLEHYTWTPEQRRSHFQQIRSAIEYMIQLVEDVMLMGKVEEGKVACNPQFIDPRMLSDSVLEEMRLIASDRHHLSLRVLGNERFLSLDPKLLRQILTNLLSNAIKYSPNGGEICLTLDYQAHAILLHVSDQGIGIPEEDQQRLFQAFHRAGNVDVIQGTGLGLAIVHRCVDIHGGSIHVQSREGEGTTFIVTLPVSD